MNRPWDYSQLPVLRQHLFDQWASESWQGGLGLLRPLFKNASDTKSVSSMADTERKLLGGASLWWVGEAMCDLLYGTMLSIPIETTINDLRVPYDNGLIFFEKPWADAMDAHSGTRTVQVDAICWGRTYLESDRGADHIPCLSFSVYRHLDLDKITASEAAVVRVFGGGLPKASSGGIWVPLGRSDWPIGEPIRGVHNNPYKSEILNDPAAFDKSIEEDRQLMATFWTLIISPSMSQVQVHEPSRQVKRQAERRGEDAPGAVNVVYLRKPKNPDPESHSSHSEYSHRFVVRAHPVLQPYGPGRTQRRLIIRGPYVKGPESKPLVIKDTVHVWTK